jgi:hypothetical protein
LKIGNRGLKEKIEEVERLREKSLGRASLFESSGACLNRPEIE